MDTDRMNEDWARLKKLALELGITEEKINSCEIPEDIQTLIEEVKT